MPRHEDFEKIYQSFIEQYGPEEGETKYFAWLNERSYDDSKPMPKKESFSWVGDIQANPAEKNLIRGKALHPVKTLHPDEWPQVRVYLDEELEKSADTLTGGILLLDHGVVVDGKVLQSAYEDGAIEYVAQVDDPRILDYIETGDIKHCSVEFNWKSLENVEGGVAPKGIEFTGLSLLKNLAPGDPMTTVEVWEGIIQTLKEAKLKENNKPETPTLEGRITFLETSLSLKEQQLTKEQITAKIDELNQSKQVLDTELQQIADKEQPKRNEIWQKIDLLNAELRAYEEALRTLLASEIVSPSGDSTEEKPTGEGLPNSQESQEPKTPKERFMNHFSISEESFQKFFDLLGEEMFKLLPEPGTKRQEQTAESKKVIGEAIISPSPGQEEPSDLINKKEILSLIPGIQVTRSWSWGPQRLVNEIMHKLGEVQ
ncbi:MAG: hypothetical protein NUK63_03300 [Candidatus Bathyarchaeum tardum]|nr:MAG: hypothetical protein NUK63_03300 [Candidatus Bathyarchaeum tardum]